MSERDDEVRGGHPAWAPHPERNGLLPEDSEKSTPPALPADLAAVQADDALLDALHGPNPSPEGSDARLTQVLMAWRDEVDTEPVIQLVDTDTALAVVARARRPEPRRGGVLVPFAAAAAVLAIALSGVGVGARAAEPGDRLWSLTKVLYTDYAESKEAAVTAQAQLKQASDLLAQGRVGEALIMLERVQDELPAVDDEESRTELQKDAGKLRDELGDQGGTDDGAGATSSGDSESAREQEEPPMSAEPPITPEDPPTEEPPVSSTPGPPDPDSPANPGRGRGGTGGGGSTPTPRYAPPPGPAAPAPPGPAAPAPPEAAGPGTPAPPESSPES